jgi:hypothetical protein
MLTANNCSIESVTLEVRAMLNAVLEDILYKDLKYDFRQFVERTKLCRESQRNEKQELIKDRKGDKAISANKE